MRWARRPSRRLGALGTVERDARVVTVRAIVPLLRVGAGLGSRIPDVAVRGRGGLFIRLGRRDPDGEHDRGAGQRAGEEDQPGLPASPA